MKTPVKTLEATLVKRYIELNTRSEKIKEEIRLFRQMECDIMFLRAQVVTAKRLKKLEINQDTFIQSWSPYVGADYILF